MDEEHIHRKKRSSNNFLAFSQGIIIILLLIIVFQLGSIKENLTDTTIKTDIEEGTDDIIPSQAQPAQPAAPKVDIGDLVDDDAIKGDKDAPVTIIEFSDFECPFCAKFYKDTYGQIVKEYVDTGKARIIFRDFPLSFHKNAQKAAEAAECAGEQDKYYEMHNKLFESGVEGGITAFKQYAVDLGINTVDFNKCLDSSTMAQEVQKDMRDGQAAGIRGTPGFVINGNLLSGAQPFSVFKQAIEAELK